MQKSNRWLRILLIILIVLLLAESTFLVKEIILDKNTIALNYADMMQSIDYGDTAYVIGHKSPDTDTVISAITYANLKKELGINCKPVISGKVNNETKYILEYFGVAMPEILENAKNKNMILVDHSTYTQTIDGMEEANIAEIIDHHGLGNVTTGNPIYIKDMAVGATATIVYTSYIENEIAIDKTIAGLLMSAILSDTNGLTSTITTKADRDACEHLAKIAQIDNMDAFYEQMREYAESYQGMTDEEIFFSDYKEYEMNGTKVGIASVNAKEGQTEIMCRKMREFMDGCYENQDMRHLYVMIQDVYGNQTILLCCGEGAEDIVKEAFGEPTDGSVVLTPSASRKKDVVPPLETAYSATR